MRVCEIYYIFFNSRFICPLYDFFWFKDFGVKILLSVCAMLPEPALDNKTIFFYIFPHFCIYILYPKSNTDFMIIGPVWMISSSTGAADSMTENGCPFFCIACFINNFGNLDYRCMPLSHPSEMEMCFSDLIL